MALRLASLPLLLVLAAAQCLHSVSAGGWQSGRATRYGGLDEPAWNIHHGSCGYGYLSPNAATGWDVAAPSDQNWDFGHGCGRCLEVRCNPSNFRDNYGQSLERSDGVCRDPESSVIVQITDTCPCNYPDNAYSNKRWCCGDKYHLDISSWAFEKLADPKWGVIGIEYRAVSCSSKPEKRAAKCPNPSPGYAPPSGWDGKDKRPYN